MDSNKSLFIIGTDWLLRCETCANLQHIINSDMHVVVYYCRLKIRDKPFAPVDIWCRDYKQKGQIKRL